jgi:hypothetical protein
MTVIVRAGAPGKLVVEADYPTSTPIDVDGTLSLYDGLHAIKEALGQWLSEVAEREYRTGYDAGANNAGGK